MSSVGRKPLRVLAALAIASLGAGACNNTFPNQIPVGGPGGSGGARGGSTGGAGATGVAGARGTSSDGGSGPALDGGSAAVDGGPLPHCAPVAPTGPVIADFGALNNQAFGLYGVDPVVGRTYVTSGTLLEDFTQGNWHLTGTVTEPVSFGFYWSCPAVTDGICTLDLSRYAGFQFTVSGDFGSPGTLQLSMGTIPDDLPTVASGCGTCSAQNICTDPYLTLNLGNGVSPPGVQTATWNYFHLGAPFPSMDPGRVTGIAWTLPAATNGSYPVDFTLDDIRLLPIPH